MIRRVSRLPGLPTRWVLIPGSPHYGLPPGNLHPGRLPPAAANSIPLKTKSSGYWIFIPIPLPRPLTGSGKGVLTATYHRKELHQKNPAKKEAGISYVVITSLCQTCHGLRPRGDKPQLAIIAVAHVDFSQNYGVISPQLFLSRLNPFSLAAYGMLARCPTLNLRGCPH